MTFGYRRHWLNSAHDVIEMHYSTQYWFVSPCLFKGIVHPKRNLSYAVIFSHLTLTCIIFFLLWRKMLMNLFHTMEVDVNQSLSNPKNYKNSTHYVSFWNHTIALYLDYHMSILKSYNLSNVEKLVNIHFHRMEEQHEHLFQRRKKNNGLEQHEADKWLNQPFLEIFWM